MSPSKFVDLNGYLYYDITDVVLKPGEVFEDAYVMRKNYELLEKGMVITIEPGLYKDKHLGIRVEDDVLITNEGCKSLTSFDRELRVI